MPISNVTLAVEVVSPGSRSQDRVLKPAQYAAAKVPYFWRAELERDNHLAVHEYWLNADTRYGHEGGTTDDASLRRPVVLHGELGQPGAVGPGAGPRPVEGACARRHGCSRGD
ncbi:Uma2 family endonuclease [Streptomyces reniochalinae]|uniref:Uma2 family endonuclease n=1 Tax=Streptomyces reniochalinae TaxID=2250578 RepID=UPI0015F04D0A